MRIRQVLIVLMWLNMLSIHAQPHFNSWFRATLSFPVNKNIKVDAELQYRRQNGFGNFNMLDKDLMKSGRTWVHYQYKPAIRFSVSPYAGFLHYKQIINEKDEEANATKEIRFAIAADFRRKVAIKLNVLYKTSMEYRCLSNYHSPVIRFRNRLGLMYEIKQKLKMTVYDEFLLNVAGINKEHIFDHNRTTMGFEYELTPAIKLEAGYIYISRLPLSTTMLLYENNLFVHLTYQIKRK